MNLAEFKNIPRELRKKGLIFYSTEEDKPHRDSKGRDFFFTDEDVKKLVENTNNYIQYSSGIPIFTEHNKDVANQVGEINTPLEVRQITEEDINHNPKWQNLLGRWGVFSDSVIIKDDNLIDKIQKGLSKTLSAGIDLKNFHIREVSLVGIPAIPNTVLFNNNMSNVVNFNALLLDEALKDSEESGKQRQKAQKIFDTLLDVLDNVKMSSTQDEVEGNMQKDMLIQQNLSQFQDKMLELYQVSDEQQPGQTDAQNLPQNNQGQNNQPSPKFSNLDDLIEYSNQIQNTEETNMQFYYLNGVPVVGYDDDVAEYGLYGKARYHIKKAGNKLKERILNVGLEGRKKRGYDIDKSLRKSKNMFKSTDLLNQKKALQGSNIGIGDYARAVRKKAAIGAAGVGAVGGAYALGRRNRDR